LVYILNINEVKAHSIIYRREILIKEFLMKILLVAILILSVYAVEDGNITCWDLCSARCKAKYGWLNDQCIKACGCPCEPQCDKLCVQFGLGWPCRFKCGCYQNYTFGYMGKSDILKENRE